jgi:hypothetical protein
MINKAYNVRNIIIGSSPSIFLKKAEEFRLKSTFRLYLLEASVGLAMRAFAIGLWMDKVASFAVHTDALSEK